MLTTSHIDKDLIEKNGLSWGFEPQWRADDSDSNAWDTITKRVRLKLTDRRHEIKTTVSES